jgi:ArsR family transcriptional regulator, arsenate/arsenite/antimonite-responsive transcriptional repressor
MKSLEKTLKVLADKNRIRIIKLLSYKKMCVCGLAHIIGITQPSISRHLQKLKSHGFISCEQDHFWTNCILKKPDDIYGASLIKFLKKWLNDDPVIKNDLIKAKKFNRNNICKQKGARKKC